MNYTIFKIKSKYIRWYYSIVHVARTQIRVKSAENYFEQHHIIPKSLGGSNDPANLVLLTAREHFLAHLCLWKHFKSINHKCNEAKMGKAFHMMTITGPKQKRYNSQLYEIARALNTNKGAIRSAKFKQNLSRIYSGAGSVTALKINIYDNCHNLIAQSHGNFGKVCKENNLPFAKLTHSYQTNTPIYYKPGQSQTKATKTGNIIYQGWYANIQLEHDSLESH